MMFDFGFRLVFETQHRSALPGAGGFWKVDFTNGIILRVTTPDCWAE